MLYMPYVSRSCFALISDYIYDDKVKNVEPAIQLKNGDVIYLSAKLIEQFFQNIFPQKIFLKPELLGDLLKKI